MMAAQHRNDRPPPGGRVPWGLIVAAALALGWQVGVAWLSWRSGFAMDFPKFYASAEHFFDGRGIYDPLPLHGRVLIGRDADLPNLNPPLFVLLTLPLGLMERSAALATWHVAMLGSLVAGAAVLARWLTGRTAGAALVVLLLCAYVPTTASIVYGQVTFPFLLLLAVGGRALSDGRDARAGFAMGLAAALKPIFGLFLLLVAIRGGAARRWGLGTWVVASLVPLPVFGVTAYAAYVDNLVSVDWYGASWNASVRGVLTRTFGGGLTVGSIHAPWLTAPASLTIQAGLGLWFVVLAVRERRVEGGDAAALVAVAVVLTLLVSPLGWLYYFPWLVVPLLVGWRRWSGARSAVLARSSLVLGWAASTVPSLMVSSYEIDDAARLWGALYFVAAILLLVPCVARPYPRAAGAASTGPARRPSGA